MPPWDKAAKHSGNTSINTMHAGKTSGKTMHSASHLHSVQIRFFATPSRSSKAGSLITWAFRGPNCSGAQLWVCFFASSFEPTSRQYPCPRSQRNGKQSSLPCPASLNFDFGTLRMWRMTPKILLGWGLLLWRSVVARLYQTSPKLIVSNHFILFLGFTVMLSEKPSWLVRRKQRISASWTPNLLRFEGS